ncbi:hypothetical protein TI04_02730 [Achromatium sp. WMS2]|nr:hypothetical protein TI04_02730 [Achromatium sp. WMS2]
MALSTALLSVINNQTRYYFANSRVLSNLGNFWVILSIVGYHVMLVSILTLWIEGTTNSA